MKKVVRIGGGSGGYTLLRGLKAFPLDITAVFTSFDSGGSAGVLRDEFGILPPRDVRRGLLALADEGQAEILRELFNYRFDNGNSSLHGHSFGNLFWPHSHPFMEVKWKESAKPPNFSILKAGVTSIAGQIARACNARRWH